MDINLIHEFQSSLPLVYQSKGHHDPDAFLRHLKECYGVQCNVVDVRHCYIRNVPQSPEGMIAVYCNPGRGAYAVTEVYYGKAISAA